MQPNSSFLQHSHCIFMELGDKGSALFRTKTVTQADSTLFRELFQTE